MLNCWGINVCNGQQGVGSLRLLSVGFIFTYNDEMQPDNDDK